MVAVACDFHLHSQSVFFNNNNKIFFSFFFFALRKIIVDKFLRKVIDHAFNAAALALGAARLAGLDLALDLVPFALGACSNPRINQLA